MPQQVTGTHSFTFLNQINTVSPPPAMVVGIFHLSHAWEILSASSSLGVNSHWKESSVLVALQIISPQKEAHLPRQAWGASPTNVD